MIIKKHFSVKRTYSQRLNGRPENIFPLLCPVRETEWVNDWDPNLVISESGTAELNCIFTIGSGKTESIWVISAFDPGNGRIDFLKITPGVTLANIEIKLELSDNITLAHISYMHTAIGPDGISFVKDFTEEYYINFMKEWESELNYYLENGQKLSK